MKKGDIMENINYNNERLVLEARKVLTISGVESVDGFSSENLKLSLKEQKIFVFGQNIKITAYDNNSKMFSAEGDFYEIKYNVKKEPLLKRLFR